MIMSTTVALTSSLPHSTQYSSLGHGSPQIEGHWCPQRSFSGQRLLHGSLVQGAPQTRSHRSRCSHSQTHSSTHAAQESPQFLQHFEWAQTATHFLVQGGHSVPW
mmetsp:Transcript_4607/g.10915  ORF Transcript_4607/g.10915 Transcript_4607/m.10915 type:complete len:105 (+) Transcript_4607:1456-1770(+)